MVGIILAFFYYPNQPPLTLELERNQTLKMQIASPPPIAQKRPVTMGIHQHQRNDPYYWLRDDSLSDEAVLGHLARENQHTQSYFASIAPLHQDLYQEIIQRLSKTKENVPNFKDGYWYSSTFEEGKEYAVHVRQQGALESPKELLLDENQRAKGSSYYNLGNFAVNNSHDIAVIAEDMQGSYIFQLSIKNLTTNNFYPEVIEYSARDVVWAKDNQSFFYVKKHPETLLPYQVYQHRLGTPSQNDKLIYQESDNTFYTSISESASTKYLIITLSATNASEVRVLDLSQEAPALKTVLPREKEHRYFVDHIGEFFYIISNDQAPDNQIVRVHHLDIGDKRKWQTIVNKTDGTIVLDMKLFNGFLATKERINGVEKLNIRSHDGSLLDEVSFPDPAYQVNIGKHLTANTTKLRFHYSSFTQPESVYEYDFTRKQKTLLQQDKVLGPFDSSNYQSERITISVRDGKQVPVSLVYRKDRFHENTKNPLLLYGYGAYGITVNPKFSSARLTLLDRGFVFAIAHIRGGGMLGKQWYDDGRLKNKRNTFNDFIDVTKALPALGYADPKHIYAQGGSAGGLLIGAVINEAPELYHGAIANVPFVDVVTTMLDDSIPLTTEEYDEWGNPNIAEDYHYMLSYSPYDQIKQQAYPHLYVASGLYDEQVQYFEPSKWVAKLRANKTNDNLLLLDMDMNSGHGGSSGRFKQYEEIAKEYAFLLSLSKQH